MRKIKRRLFIRGIAAGAAGGLTAWIQPRACGRLQIATTGHHRIEGRSVGERQARHQGLAGRAGDVVETGKGARAVYLIDDNVFLQRQNSRVEFGNSVETFLRIVTGGLLGVFGKGGRELTTPVGTIRDARGSGLVM